MRDHTGEVCFEPVRNQEISVDLPNLAHEVSFGVPEDSVSGAFKAWVGGLVTGVTTKRLVDSVHLSPGDLVRVDF